ncbi:hypothetical protein DW114_07735 [Absiella sp. AM09-50]|nr:hypothetical protein DW114_07735 [Absiella sp. AM09-50]
MIRIINYKRMDFSTYENSFFLNYKEYARILEKNAIFYKIVFIKIYKCDKMWYFKDNESGRGKL